MFLNAPASAELSVWLALRALECRSESLEVVVGSFLEYMPKKVWRLPVFMVWRGGGEKVLEPESGFGRGEAESAASDWGGADIV